MALLRAPLPICPACRFLSFAFPVSFPATCWVAPLSCVWENLGGGASTDDGMDADTPGRRTPAAVAVAADGCAIARNHSSCWAAVQVAAGLPATPKPIRAGGTCWCCACSATGIAEAGAGWRGWRFGGSPALGLLATPPNMTKSKPLVDPSRRLYCCSYGRWWVGADDAHESWNWPPLRVSFRVCSRRGEGRSPVCLDVSTQASCTSPPPFRRGCRLPVVQFRGNK